MFQVVDEWGHYHPRNLWNVSWPPPQVRHILHISAIEKKLSQLELKLFSNDIFSLFQVDMAYYTSQ